MEIKMPQLNPMMQEGTIGEWNKKVGDAVSVGDVICSIEGNKETTNLEVEVSGILTKIAIEEGCSADCDEVIAVVE